MKKINLENVTIQKYCNMLKSGEDKEILTAIDSELSKALGNFSGGFDLSLFMLQKDLLIFQCKLAISIFDFDGIGQSIYEKKINELKKAIEKKAVKAEPGNPYKSFLSWILSVEKYLAFSIDRNNDLLYLSEATKQMLNFYDSQKKQIEENKANKKSR